MLKTVWEALDGVLALRKPNVVEASVTRSTRSLKSGSTYTVPAAPRHGCALLEQGGNGVLGAAVVSVRAQYCGGPQLPVKTYVNPLSNVAFTPPGFVTVTSTTLGT